MYSSESNASTPAKAHGLQAEMVTEQEQVCHPLLVISHPLLIRYL